MSQNLPEYSVCFLLENLSWRTKSQSYPSTSYWVCICENNFTLSQHYSRFQQFLPWQRKHFSSSAKLRHFSGAKLLKWLITLEHDTHHLIRDSYNSGSSTPSPSDCMGNWLQWNVAGYRFSLSCDGNIMLFHWWKWWNDQFGWWQSKGASRSGTIPPPYHCILLYSPLAHVIQPKALVPSEGHHMIIITIITIILWMEEWRGIYGCMLEVVVWQPGRDVEGLIHGFSRNMKFTLTKSSRSNL